MTKISPSLLSCDFTKIGEEIDSIREGGADMAHLDIMDGVFVPNISFGLPVVQAIRKYSDMFLDVHLMIINPEKYIERFIEAGADIVTFHIEATKCADTCIELIRSRGKTVGISIKPDTPIETVVPYLNKCDMILIMTVEPGFGGQSLIPECLEKVAKLKAEIQNLNLDVEIQVDGGIKPENAEAAKAAGANVLVAGSSVFKAPDRKAAIDALR